MIFYTKIPELPRVFRLDSEEKASEGFKQFINEHIFSLIVIVDESFTSHHEDSIKSFISQSNFSMQDELFNPAILLVKNEMTDGKEERILEKLEQEIFQNMFSAKGIDFKQVKSFCLMKNSMIPEDILTKTDLFDIFSLKDVFANSTNRINA